MENYDLKKGLICGTIGVLGISLQPIIANSRPSVIDPYIFAAVTALIMATIFFPLFVFERHKLKSSIEVNSDEKTYSLLNGWKKKNNLKFLAIIGITFSIVPVLLFLSFDLAGAINSSLTLKSEVFFALLFGYIILKEKRISKVQLLFCATLFFGLFIAITQGSFNLLEFNVGVLILLIDVALFTLVHTFTKTRFDRNEFSPIQVVFIRSLLSGIIVFSTYFIFFPLDRIIIVFNPNYFIYYLLMGLDYSVSLFFWYKTLSYIQIGKAGVLNSLTPILTALFSWIILGDVFTIFHLIGMIIVIISIYMIVREKKIKKNLILNEKM
jgi:drug/metabolite transporter (DMT)-like permease